MTLYKCPSCEQVGDKVMHRCPAHHNLPLSRVKVENEDDKPDAKHVEVMREDYVGADGAMAAVSTVRPDGSNDLTVIPMVARAHADGGTFYRRHHWRDPELEYFARLSARYDLRMAWSASAWFAYEFVALLGKLQSIAADTWKCALYSSNTMTPDKTVATAALSSYNGAASQWLAANENVGAGYTAGGAALTSFTDSQASNVVTLQAADTVWASPVTVSAYGDLIYDTTAASQGLCFNYFGGAQNVNAGGFTLHWANGVAAITV